MNEIQSTAAQIRKRLWNPPNGRASGEIEILPEYVIQKMRAKLAMEARQAEIDARRTARLEEEIEAARAAHEAYEAERKLASIDMPPKPPRPSAIIAAVCRKYNIREIDILSHRRTANVVLPRQIAMYLCKILTFKSLPEIGKRFAGKDHTTVLHGVRKIARLVENHPELAADVEEIKRALGIE